MASVRFAAAVAGTSDWPTLRAACREAEAGGFDAFSRPDHLLAEGVLGPPGAPLLECFTTIAALVPTTTRLRFLQTVTCSSFRNPALLAKMVATLDVISGGRMELGIGAGWLRAEYEAYGYEFPPMPVRLEQLHEALRVVKLLWSGESVDFGGDYFKLNGYASNPRPVQQPWPTILYATSSEGGYRFAATQCDEAFIQYGDQMNANSKRLKELAGECGSQQQVLHETNRLIAGKLGDSESVREKSAPCLLRGLRRARKVFDVSAAMMS